MEHSAKQSQSQSQSQSQGNKSSMEIVNIVTLPEGTFNATTLTIGTPKKNSIGQGLSAPIKFRGKPLSLQTPKMRSPFGISKYEDPQNQNQNTAPNGQEKDKWTISLSFDDNIDVPITESKSNKFLASLNDFDDALIDNGCKESCKELVGKNKQGKLLARDIVADRFGPSVKVPTKQPESGTPYPNTFRVKLNTNTSSDYSTRFFNPRGELLKIDFNDASSPHYYKIVVPNNSSCIVVAYPSIWSAAEKWGVRWVAQQVVVFPASKAMDFTVCQVNVPEEDLENNEAVDPEDSQDPEDPQDKEDPEEDDRNDDDNNP